jgi:hypothetical protein
MNERAAHSHVSIVSDASAVFAAGDKRLHPDG